MKKMIKYIMVFVCIFIVSGCNIIQNQTPTLEEITKTQIPTESIEKTPTPTIEETAVETEEKTPTQEIENTLTPTPAEPTPTPTPVIKYYSVTVEYNNEFGRVDTNKTSGKTGDKILIDIRPNEGCSVEGIYINGEKIEEDYFYIGEEDVILNVIFNKKCTHSFGVDGSCIYCGAITLNPYLYELFGSDITTYTNGEENPYNINLDTYGSDVTVYFYEPNLSILTDPYASVNKSDFYENYEVATTYEDAYFRSKHFLMSGDITPQNYLPVEGKIEENGSAIKVSTATYILNTDGSYLAYIPNVIDGDNYIIFYGAGYISLNEVAAYLLAFGEVPANTISSKGSSGQKQAINNWGVYGRVNDSRFSGDTSKYPYEPELPNILGANSIIYNEMDFGTTGGYSNSNSLGTNYKQVEYNTGTKITRGAARMVYVSDTKVKSIESRHVFYTYNHYNDFQEYLNYHNGWGYRFGNESAGNEYVSSTNEFYSLGCVPVTKYPEVLLKKYSEIM